MQIGRARPALLTAKSRRRAEPAPTCPSCRSRMSVVTARRGETAGAQHWQCTRYPTCRGERPLAATPRTLERIEAMTAQQTFDRRTGMRPRIVVGLPALRRSSPGDNAANRRPRYLGGLEEAGFVVLSRRLLPGGRGEVDHLIVGPTGVYVVQTKPWTGQISVAQDRLYVDGRLRHGVPESVQRAATHVHEALVGELKAHAVGAAPVLCFPNLELPLFRERVGGVMVTGGRGLSRALRDGDPVLSVRAVDEIALATHEIFEPVPRVGR